MNSEDVIRLIIAMIGIPTSIGGVILMWKKILRSRVNRLELARKLDRALRYPKGNFLLCENFHELYQVKCGRKHIDVIMNHENPLLLLEVLRKNSGLVIMTDSSVSYMPGKESVVRTGIYLMKGILYILLLHSGLILYMLASEPNRWELLVILLVQLFVNGAVICWAMDQVTAYKNIIHVITNK